MNIILFMGLMLVLTSCVVIYSFSTSNAYYYGHFPSSAATYNVGGYTYKAQSVGQHSSNLYELTNLKVGHGFAYTQLQNSSGVVIIVVDAGGSVFCQKINFLSNGCLFGVVRGNVASG